MYIYKRQILVDNSIQPFALYRLKRIKNLSKLRNNQDFFLEENHVRRHFELHSEKVTTISRLQNIQSQ
jgi:hypothetical protein